MAKRISTGRHDKRQLAPARPQTVVSQPQPAQKLLFAQYATTKVLAESATLGEAASGILQAICESLGWEYGALWTVDRHARCAALYRHLAHTRR